MEAVNTPNPNRYDNGGTLHPGVTWAVNTGGKPEPVALPQDGGDS